MSRLTLVALLDMGLPGSQGDSLHYRCPYPLPTKNSLWLFRQLPCGVTSNLQSGRNSVLTIQQWSRCWVQYITRFELEGAATSPLPDGGPALLCIYCSSRFWKIKCHSWHHSSFWISAVPSASSLCVSHTNANTSFGLGPAACSLDQKCQFYLSNGLAPSSRQVYRSAQRQFISFCTLDGYVSSDGSLMNKPCCVFVPT